MLALVSNARAHGITEIKYKELHLKLSLRAQTEGSGPVAQAAPGQMRANQPLPSLWSNSIPIPEAL